MMKANNTKKAFLTSLLSLILCVTMMMGTTFAWFTDEVSTGNNIIQSGTLKIDLEHKVGDEWVSLKEDAKHAIWSEDVLWEPGYTSLETVRIVNKGNLALKYILNVSYTDVSASALADVIDVYLQIGEKGEGRPDLSDTTVWEKVGTLNDLVSDPDGAAYGILLPAGAEPKREGEVVESISMNVVLHMREDAGNEYQGLSLGNVYLDLLAMQYTYESDSFDDQYDADADFPANVLIPGADLNALIKGDNANAVKKIVFGENKNYTDVIATAEGVNVDDKGAIKLYRIDGTVYILSDRKIEFNEDSTGAMRDLPNLEEVVTDNTSFNLVKKAAAMFYNDTKLKKVDVSVWNTSNVELMNHFFYSCSSLTEANVEGWNTANATSMKSMFSGCTSLTEIPVENWNTSKVEDFSFFFNNCQITELDLRNWDTSSALTLKCLFQNCKKLENVNVEGWDTSKVQDFGWLFQNCYKIKSVDLSSWDTSSATKLNNLFCHAEALEEVDISTWDVRNVTDFSNMLQYTKVKNIDVSKWVTSSATNMTHMFANNGRLEKLDLINFDTRKVTNVTWMFYGAHSMEEIVVGDNWSLDSVADMNSGVFYECYKLVGGNGTTWGDVCNGKTAYATVACPDSDGQLGLLTKK